MIENVDVVKNLRIRVRFFVLSTNILRVTRRMCRITTPHFFEFSKVASLYRGRFGENSKNDYQYICVRLYRSVLSLALRQYGYLASFRTLLNDLDKRLKKIEKEGE